jgi:hypothetical protein
LLYFDIWALFFDTLVFCWAAALGAFGQAFDLLDLTLVAFDVVYDLWTRYFHLLFVAALARSFAVRWTALVFFFDGCDVLAFTSFWFFSTGFFSGFSDIASENVAATCSYYADIF